jgi:hypothetical protein
MPDLTLTFDNPLPESIQTGDQAWFLDIGGAGQEISLGPITSITPGPPQWTIIIDIAVGAAVPTVADFIFYVKDPIGKVGQLKGYYAEAQFRNNTTAYAELFSVGSEIFESSK